MSQRQIRQQLAPSAKRRKTHASAPTAKHMQYTGSTNLLLLPDDCLSLVIEFMDTRTWIKFSYTCIKINEIKHNLIFMVNKQRTLLFFWSNPTDMLQSMVTAENALFNLSMSFTSYVGDETLQLLVNLRTLNISYCQQFSDAALRCLPKLRSLSVSGCMQLSSAAFENMKELRTLTMIECHLPKIRDAFRHLPALTELDISSCTYVTDAMFEHLEGLRVLKMGGHTTATITDAAFQQLPNLEHLSLCGSDTTTTLTPEAFKNLGKLTILDLSCCQRTLGDEVFAQLPNLTELDISRNIHFTDAAFLYLKGLTKLNINDKGVTDSKEALYSFYEKYKGPLGSKNFTDAAFSGLNNLRELDMIFLERGNITDWAFAHIPKLTKLAIGNMRQQGLTGQMFAYLNELHTLGTDSRGFDQDSRKYLGRLRSFNGCSTQYGYP